MNTGSDEPAASGGRGKPLLVAAATALLSSALLTALPTAAPAFDVQGFINAAAAIAAQYRASHGGYRARFFGRFGGGHAASQRGREIAERDGRNEDKDAKVVDDAGLRTAPGSAEIRASSYQMPAESMAHEGATR